MIYMKHPDHGATHFYSEGDALAAEKNGWVRHPWPPAPIEEKQEIHAEPEPKRRGRPPKVIDGD